MSETVTAAPEGASEQQAAPESAPVENTTSPPEAPQTIRDSALAAYEAIERREREEAKPRDETGRYAGQNDAEPEAAAQAERLAPPEGFSDKAQVDWNRLPRSVQEGILSRVNAAPPVPPPDPFVETARNLRGAFEQHGLIPERALPEIVQAWQALVANPREVLPELAKRFGVEYGQPAQPNMPNQQSNAWVDPEIAALKTELAQLKERAEAQARAEQARAAAEEQRIYRALNEELTSFSKDKPDFETLRNDMAALLRTGAAKDLADAYEKAAWANPATRTARLEAERKAEEAKRLAEAEKAKKAPAVNVRSDSRVNPAPPKSIRETMERTAERLFTG